MMAVSAYEDRSHGNPPYDHQQRASDRIDAECAEVFGAERAKCENEIANSEAENYRSYEDLKAQQQSAKWARWTAILALASAVLTAVGSVLVWQTLGQTVAANRAAQKAIEVTRRIGEAQVRAYVSFGNVKTLISGHAFVITALHFTPVVRNTGQSPAAITGLYSFLDVLDPHEIPTVRFPRGSAETTHTLGADGDYQLVELVLSAADAHTIWRGIKRCYIMGWAEYATVFDEDGQTSTINFCFEVQFRANPLSTRTDQAEHLIRLHARRDYLISPEDEA